MSGDVEVTTAEATIAIGAAAIDVEVTAAATDIAIEAAAAEIKAAKSSGEVVILGPETDIAIGTSGLDISFTDVEITGGLDVVAVTDIAYSAIHGKTSFTCNTDRNAQVQFKMTNLTYGTKTSAWSNVGTSHAVDVLNTTGGQTWAVYVRADAVEDPDLDWMYLGDIDVPPRGEIAVEGELHIGD